VSKKTAKLNSKFVAALMVLVSLSSATSSFAYPSGDNVEADTTHDSAYVKSLQKGMKGDLPSESGATGIGIASKVEVSADADKNVTPAPAGAATTGDAILDAVDFSWVDEPKGNAPTSGSQIQNPVSPTPGAKPNNCSTTTDKAPQSEAGATEHGAYLPDWNDDIDGRPIASLPPVMPVLPEPSDVIIIDNDTYKKDSSSKNGSEQVSSWADVKAEDGKSVICAGARFPVVLQSSHTSRNSKIGDRVEARLKADIMIGDRVIAREGDQVVGHVSSVHKARRILLAQLSPKRWLRANGAVGIKFDEIITFSGEHVPLTAAPARMARIIENKAEGRILGVNHKGEMVAPLSTQLKNQGIQFAIRGAAGAGGVFSMGAVPILFGLIGAANPSFAFLHPVGKNVPHRRWKGFGMGFLSGLPGGFLVADFILRGVEASLKPGDEFLVEFHQDFNGQAATTAELQPQERMKVQAEVVKKKSKTQKTKKRPSESTRKVVEQKS